MIILQKLDKIHYTINTILPITNSLNVSMRIRCDNLNKNIDDV